MSLNGSINQSESTPNYGSFGDDSSHVNQHTPSENGNTHSHTGVSGDVYFQPSSLGRINEGDDNLVLDESSQLLGTGTKIEIEHEVTGSSWYSSVFLVVNAALGAGLLNFPAAYNQSGGIAVAVGVQAALMVLIIASLLILIYCSDVHQSATYQDVLYSLGGRSAQFSCSIGIVLYTFGTCITFFIIIADQWEKFFNFLNVDQEAHWYSSRTFTLVSTCVILVLPICFPKRIDFLKYASILGVIAVLYCVILVTLRYFLPHDPPPHIKTHPDHWSDVFMVMPVICFSYQCHLSVVPIYSCMKKRTVPEFTKTLLVAIALCLFAYTGTASFGYLTFGTAVKGDILLSYKPTGDIVAAVILVAVKMYTTYPILLFVGRAACESVITTTLIAYFDFSPESIARREKIRRIVLTTVWFCTTLLIAVVVDNIDPVIKILGALAALFAFVFPGICLLGLLHSGHIHPVHRRHLYNFLMALSLVNIVLGTFIFGLVLTEAIMFDISGGQQ